MDLLEELKKTNEKLDKIIEMFGVIKDILYFQKGFMFDKYEKYITERKFKAVVGGMMKS